MLSPTQKKWRLFRTFSARRPVWAAWQVTYRCNFRCRFCHYWCDPMGQQGEPPVSDYAAGARKLANYGSMLISLAGGEPLLRTDLPEIVSAVGEYHFPFLTTNGWLVTRDAARSLMDSGLWGASVSIDYAAAAPHDAARGVQGAWKQAWRAVELLCQARQHDYQRVNVMGVLLKDNLDHLERLLQMAAERGAYFMIQPYGFRKTGSRRHAHDDGAVSPRLLELRAKYPNFLSNPGYLKRFDEFLDEGIDGCRAGRAFFNIDSTGDVAICVERRPRPVANLYRDSAAVIDKRLRAGSRDNRCRDCWYNCRGEVESLYAPGPLLHSLPTLLLDRGRAPQGADRP